MPTISHRLPDVAGQIDFANEIIAVGEGLMRGELTSAQRKYVEDYFKLLPLSLDEFLEQEAARYVGRKDLYNSHRHIAEKTVGDADALVELSQYLDKGYDHYVHAGYATAMELYDPYTGYFSVLGTPSERNRCIAKVAIAGKLYHCMVALELMPRLRGLSTVVKQINAARAEFEQSPEYHGSVCD